MKPPVDHVRVSSKGRAILIKLKARTGLEHWNELCRVALCRSLSNPKPPTISSRVSDNAIDMEWKTFAGAYSAEFSAAVLIRAQTDGVNMESKEAVGEYLRAHIERGVASLQNVKTLAELVKNN